MKTITRSLQQSLSRKLTLNLSIATFSIITLLNSITYVSASAQSNTSNIKQNTQLKTQTFSQPKVKTDFDERKTYWQKNKTALLTMKNTQMKKHHLREKSGFSRESFLLVMKQKSAEKKPNNSQSVLVNSSSLIASSHAYLNTYPGDFSIYDASSYLLDDIDGDGYYQSFSIIFDADYHPYYTSGATTGQANVYAILYLRQNDGDWQQFHSTEVFSIYSDTSNDEFEVFTTLEQGFSSDSFNVLIDLYYAGSDQLVATYSSNNNNSLYALPLESADHDKPYVVEIIHTEGGNSSITLLLITVLVIF